MSPPTDSGASRRRFLLAAATGLTAAAGCTTPAGEPGTGPASDRAASNGKQTGAPTPTGATVGPGAPGAPTTTGATVGPGATGPSITAGATVAPAGAQPSPTDPSPGSAAPSPGAGGTSARPPAAGVHQAGIVTPNPPQPHLLLVVGDVTGDPDPLLADLGRAVLALTAGGDPRLAGVEPGDLTVTVGIGPRLIARAGAGLPGAGTIPAFSRERIPAAARGGDLVLQLCAGDPVLLPLALAALVAIAAGRFRERWRQRGFRGPYVTIDATEQAPRNVFGFVDGISVPTTEAGFDAGVWSVDARVAGATVMAVRRMEVDLTRFLALPVSAQEAVFGRRRDTSAPLSGGTAATDPDLGAKTPTGAYRIPAHSHLRMAHPKPLGLPLMLRRSYSVDDPSPGLLFVSFSPTLDVFVRTLAHLDTGDALLDFTTTTASAGFLVLPGFSADQPLGHGLFGP